MTECLRAQVATNKTNPQPAPATPPLTTAIKKSVVFIETTCLAHVSEQDFANVAPAEVAKLPPKKYAELQQQLIALLLGLKKIETKLETLTPGRSVLSPLEIQQLSAPEKLSDQEKIAFISKLLSLTSDDVSKLTPEEINSLPKYTVMGTGFFVSVHDERLKADENFVYLVTNRHVTQPGIEDDRPCVVLNYSVYLNRLPTNGSGADALDVVTLGIKTPWHYAIDPGVDLAVVPITLPRDVYDAAFIPQSLFITDEMLTKKQVVEGDPMLFAGLFIQTFADVHKLEPIVRSGTVAMIPEGLMKTTLKRPGHIFLTDAHVYHGNSGAPAFVDIAKFSGSPGYNYYFLGVVSGEIPESADYTLQVVTTLKGTTEANSDVSTVVPAKDLNDILNSDSLKKERDDSIQRLNKR
jgi:hypothetical protein